MDLETEKQAGRRKPEGPEVRTRALKAVKGIGASKRN